MKLTDYFKRFQVISQNRNFEANARSLYYAILEAFDAAFYPSELVMPNVYLQARSGIKSTSSFDAARTKLINNKLITHRKQVYRLIDAEKVVERESKDNRKVIERSIGSISNTNKENTNTNTAQTPPTTGGRASEAVLKAWAEANGIRLKGSYALKMAEYEQRLGSQKLIALIEKAGANNSRECISLQYLEAYIFNELKEKKRADLSADYGAIDELPC